MKFSALCVAGALLVPGAAAAKGTADAKLEVRAAVDTAAAQRLAHVAPRKADALLKRSRSELRAAFEKTEKVAAAKRTRALGFSRRLGADVKAMRDIAHTSSGPLARHAVQAARADISMQRRLAELVQRGPAADNSTSSASTQTGAGASTGSADAQAQGSVSAGWPLIALP